MINHLFHPLTFKTIKVFFTVMLFAAAGNLYAQDIFKDDFNRNTLGSDWQTEGWRISIGAAYNPDVGYMITTNAYKDSSYVLETAAMGFTNDYYREFRFTFGQSGQDLYQNAYVLKYTEYPFSYLSLARGTDNIFYPEYYLDGVHIYPVYQTTKWYKFKIARYKSGLIQVYVDRGFGYGDTPLLEAIDSAYKTLGHFGWHQTTETASKNFYVDYIRASKPATEKPAVREKPAADSLIAEVKAESERTYTVTKLNTGVKAYTDRNHTITSIPLYLSEASFLQTAMGDKYNTLNKFLSLYFRRDAVVYIAYDARATSIPAWLSKWTKTGDVIKTTDPKSSNLQVYSMLTSASKSYPPIPLILGGNLASPAVGAKINYLVAAVKRPDSVRLEAEDALLSGTVVNSNHPGYTGTGFADYKNQSNDYIEWTVNITVPGTYSLGFFYANAGTTDRPLKISADGTDISILSFTKNSGTLSWSDWLFSSGPKIFFTNGTHKIRATATGRSGPNIDALSISYYSTDSTSIAPRPNFTAIRFAGKSSANAANVFPNPFAENVTINYTLEEKANVVLSIYSLQGQRLQLLVNDVKEKGTYYANFNAARLSAGIYFYRLQIGNEIETGKLIKE